MQFGFDFGQIAPKALWLTSGTTTMTRCTSKTKVLHTVEYYYPSKGGAQEVVRRISEELVKRGHEVTVATARLPSRTFTDFNGVEIKEFSVSGNQVRGFGGDTRSYQDFILNSDFDVMMNYAAQEWTADLVFPILEQVKYKKILAPCGFSGLHNDRYTEFFRKMPMYMRRYDHLIFHSNSYQDVEFARRYGLTGFSIIPNGASEEEFANLRESRFRKMHSVPSGVPLLLTVGSHTGLKGHSLVIDAFQRSKIGKSVLVIIGNKFGFLGCRYSCLLRAYWNSIQSFGNRKVLLLDPPRVDVLEAFIAADLFVFGSEVECSPLVLFEAMAAGLPFITLDSGNSSEIVEWGRGGVVLRSKELQNGRVKGDPSEMAHAIEELLADRDEMARLGAAGRRAWAEKFTWKEIASRYEEVYKTVVNGKNVNNM